MRLRIGHAQDAARAEPGLARRFNLDAAFRFDDFSDAELRKILVNAARKDGLVVPRAVADAAVAYLREGARAQPATRARSLTLLGEAKQRLAARDPSRRARLEDLLGAAGAAEAAEAGDPTAALRELDGLHGVEHVREHSSSSPRACACARARSATTSLLNNYVFHGAARTGKATIARAMGKMLYRLGVLSTDATEEVSALDLQGSYVGQTKDKLNDVFKKAQGGVLFVDEAYTLGNGHYAQEAVDQLVALCTAKRSTSTRRASCSPGTRTRWTG